MKERGFIFEEDPVVRPLKLMHQGVDLGKLLKLQLALNTAQTGRTFEVFLLLMSIFLQLN